jgi:aminoglycoside phosphotransferase family enzyme/predicted kinase
MARGQLPPHIEALLSPSAYPHPARRVELVQTHISYVLLAGDYVYKVKKPVDLGFLDYSTLEKRRFYCEEEVRLNRRLCPEAYLGVVPITSKGESVALAGTGEVVEYAVKMKRLPQERMMEALLEKDTVTSDMLTALTGKLAAFHRSSERSGRIDSFGGEETIRANWQENFEQTQPYIGRTISQQQWEAIKGYVEAFLESEREMLRQRVSEGRIRDCHGDLRANAVCFEDGICIFDCIEFNERFRYSDVASDLAFLAMDIDFRGHRALADEMVGLYLAQSLDTTLSLVLPFYKCYRAFVRGKVDGFQLDQREIPAEQRAAAQAGARRYFDLAEQYALRSCPPTLIAMVGATGSGKSYLAYALAGRLGAPVISSDVVRKELAGLDPTHAQAEPMGAGIYSPDMTAHTYDEMRRRAHPFLERRRPLILDATHLKREQRQKTKELAQTMGIPFLAVECVATERLVRERLQQRQSAVWSPSDGRWEVYEAQMAGAEPLSELPDRERLTVDGSLPLSEQIERVLARVGA